MSSLLLSPVTWDLLVDASGNIAVASAPYALAQDAACAIQTYLGEVYYDTSQGVPYANIQGKPLSLNYLKMQLSAAAETVPGVVSAQVFIVSFTARKITGQVQVTDSTGTTTAATF